MLPSLCFLETTRLRAEWSIFTALNSSIARELLKPLAQGRVNRNIFDFDQILHSGS